MKPTVVAYTPRLILNRNTKAASKKLRKKFNSLSRMAYPLTELVMETLHKYGVTICDKEEVFPLVQLLFDYLECPPELIVHAKISYTGNMLTELSASEGLWQLSIKNASHYPSRSTVKLAKLETDEIVWESEGKPLPYSFIQELSYL